MSDSTITGTIDVSGTTSGSIDSTGSIDTTGTTSASGTLSGSITTDATITIDSTGSISASEPTVTTTGTMTSPAVVTAPPAPAAPSAPAVTKIAPAPKPVSTIQESNDARQVAIVEELLGNYKKILSVRVVNEAGFRAAAVDLSSALIRVLNNPHPPSIDVVWDFFVANAGGVMQETVALSGTEALALGTRQRTELAYALLRKATKGIDVSNPKLVNQSVLQTQLKSPKFVAYLVEKAKTVAAQA